MTNVTKNAGTRKETKKARETRILKERRKLRVDLGSDRNVMTTPELPGMVVRWVNDEMKGGVSRIDRLRYLGWEVYDGQLVDVTTPTSIPDANVSKGSGAMIAVGLDREGKAMNAILMKIPREIWEADQAIKEEAIQEKEEAMLGEGDAPGMYGGIRVGTA